MAANPTSIAERYSQKVIARVARAPLIGAWRAVAVTTVLVTVAGGLLMRLTDPKDFPNVWTGLWWAVQTVTTVGYGDALPESVAGRIVAALVMLGGIGFLTVTTAAITSVFVTAARQRTGEAGGHPDLAALERKIEDLTEEVRGLRRDARGEGTSSPPGGKG